MTLFLSLVCIWWADRFWKKKNLRYLAFIPAIVICALYYFQVLDSDYGIRGIGFAFVFFYFAKEKKSKPWALVVGMLVAIYHGFILDCVKWFVFGRAVSFPMLSSWEITQVYSLFALPLILKYNGKKGNMPAAPVAGKLTQLGFYLFYPAHMLALWLIRVL